MTNQNCNKQDEVCLAGVSYVDDANLTVQLQAWNSDCQRIIQAARFYGVPIYEDSELSKALCSQELDENLPIRLIKALKILLQG